MSRAYIENISMSRTTFFLTIIFCLLGLAGCTKTDNSTYKESRVLMDTYCTITVVSSSKEKAKEAIDAGFGEIKKLEELLNYFSDSSEISAVNSMAGIKPVRVSKETLEILNKTMNISTVSGGAFDPTLAPVITLWNFSEKKSDPELPSDYDIEEALKLVGFNKIRINNEKSEIYLEEKGMELDLGGIAKGYAADKALKVIISKGIDAALVAVAGDIKGAGYAETGKSWKVGIQNPRPEGDSDKPWEDVFATVELRDRAISTSGDYQRFFVINGKRYHHILNPETGFPAESGLISVSVVAPEGYRTDSLATAVFVLGPEKGLRVLQEMGLDGVLVDTDKKVYITEGLRGKVDLLIDDYRPVDSIFYIK